MKIYYLFPALVISALAGCRSDNSTTGSHAAVYNDFESMSGWVPDAQLPSLSRDVAHSGHYSLRAGAGAEYSMSFKKPLHQAFDTQPTKIKISVWALLSTPEAKGTLVLTITNPNTPDAKPLLWTGVNLFEAVKVPNKWTEVSQTIELPATATPESIITVYLWGNTQQPVYIDDIAMKSE